MEFPLKPPGKARETLRALTAAFRQAQVGAFGAQAAFFVLLSAVPFMIFLTAILQYLPWSQTDLAAFLPDIFGTELLSFLANQNPTAAVLSLSAVTALWSASRGMVALTRGLNRMFGCNESRSWLRLRFFALAETLILEIVLLCTLGGAVLGEALWQRLGLEGALWQILNTLGEILLLTAFFLFLYTVLPDHTTSLKKQLPGAVAGAAGWIIFTEGYSFYVEKIADFPRLYGALSNVAMLMLWLWLCLCIFFCGAFFNRILDTSRFPE